MDYQEKINQVVRILEKSRSVLFITGAGISAESGLPTYRGVGGLYDDVLTDDNIPIEVALSGFTMERNPQLTWKYLSEIEKACRGATYNRAHKVIAEMESHFDRVVVFTQNVDGFHREAGSKNIIDIHGDIHNLYCPRCKHGDEQVDYAKLDIPPRCPRCGTVMRPDVIFFGEYLKPDKIARIGTEMDNGFDIIFTVGTSSVFPYITGPVLSAARKNIPTVEINPSETEVSGQVTFKFAHGAVKVLTDIWNALLAQKNEIPGRKF